MKIKKVVSFTEEEIEELTAVATPLGITVNQLVNQICRFSLGLPSIRSGSQWGVAGEGIDKGVLVVKQADGKIYMATKEEA